MTLQEYERQLKVYSSLMSRPINIYPKPILEDDKSGYMADGHYYYMNRWAFKKILKARPESHVDYGSQLDWIGIISEITKVTCYDIRQMYLEDEENVKFRIGSVTDTKLESDSIGSLSCLHVAEHIGLGRYGDALDPEGTIKACKELARVLKPSGSLYFAIPVGVEAELFNAHRVTTPEGCWKPLKG